MQALPSFNATESEKINQHAFAFYSLHDRNIWLTTFFIIFTPVPKTWKTSGYPGNPRHPLEGSAYGKILRLREGILLIIRHWWALKYQGALGKRLVLHTSRNTNTQLRASNFLLPNGLNLIIEQQIMLILYSKNWPLSQSQQSRVDLAIFTELEEILVVVYN